MLKQLFKHFYNLYLRKKQKLGLLNLGKPSYIHATAKFKYHKNITIGKYCRIGMECNIDGEGIIEIGDGTILAPRVIILSSSHDYNNAGMLPYGIEDKKLPVKIGKGCWIGWGAMLRPGVTIGDGAVIAMGSVVTKNVNKGEVVGGNPAKVINSRQNIDEITGMIDNDQYFVKEVLDKSLVRKGRNTNLNNNLIK